MQTLNLDVEGLYNRINRMIEEAQLSASANLSQISEADLTRMKANLGALNVYHDHVLRMPALDWVETNNKVIELKEAPPLLAVENESIEDLCRYYQDMRDELVHSQSSRMKSGLVSFDSDRLRAVTNRCLSFIEEYVEIATPLDLPKTSPMDPRVPEGKKGI